MSQYYVSTEKDKHSFKQLVTSARLALIASVMWHADTNPSALRTGVQVLPWLPGRCFIGPFYVHQLTWNLPSTKYIYFKFTDYPMDTLKLCNKRITQFSNYISLPPSLFSLSSLSPLSFSLNLNDSCIGPLYTRTTLSWPTKRAFKRGRSGTLLDARHRVPVLSPHIAEDDGGR